MARPPTAIIRYDDEDTDESQLTVSGAAPSAEPADELLLGRYRLSKQLGSGAFGTVWLARDERLDRDVAVKALPRDRVVHQRFEREARAAARLQHPAIVTLYEAAVDDQGAYLVSELVRGKTFDVLLDAGKFSDHDVLEVGIALCQALSHAHEQGVIHRDVKPSNVLVPGRSSNVIGRAKLTDFGVAQVIGSDTLTQAGDVIGTLAYMSPEQAEGREATGASDLYSLALVLYEALSGVNPVQGRRLTGRGRNLAPFIPPLRRQRRDLPKTLAAAIDRALATRPAERGTIDDLYAELRASLDLADETPGIVAPGWQGQDEATVIDEDQPGPEWHEQASQPEQPNPHEPQAARHHRFAGLGQRSATASQGFPEWLPRAASAVAAGITAELLVTHLLKTAPLAPAASGLVAAGAVLLFPRLGWLATILVIAGFAVDQGRTGGGLLFAAVTLVPLALIWIKGEVLALPAAAPLLGLIGLAGAWPAIAGRKSFTWYQRAVLGATGYIWTVVASAFAERTLYWWPLRAGHAAYDGVRATAGTGPPSTHAWIGSAHATYHVIVAPLMHAPGIAGAAVWAIAAAVLPLIRTGRWPMLDLIAAAAWAVVTVAAVGALGAHALHGAMIGAVIAFVVAGWPALTVITRQLRDGARETAPVL